MGWGTKRRAGKLTKERHRNRKKLLFYNSFVGWVLF